MVKSFIALLNAQQESKDYFVNYFEGDVNVPFALQGSMTVTGPATFNSTSLFLNSVTIGSDLTVIGNTNIENVQISRTVLDTFTGTSTMNISGFSTFESDALIKGNLVINGGFTALGSITSIQTTQLSVLDKNITINKGGTDIEGAGLDFEKDGAPFGWIRVDGDEFKFKTKSNNQEARLGINLTVPGIATIGDSLTVMSTLNVSGNTILGSSTSNTVNIKGLLTAENNLAVDGSLTVMSTLNVSGNTILGSSPYN